MKALVLEVKNGASAVLLEDGTVSRVNMELEVGRTVELREVAKPKRSGKIKMLPTARRVAAAAAAAVIVVSGSGTFYYQTAYACTYVSLDVNPSIEFSLNRQDRVLTVKPMNEDAEIIVEKLMESEVKGDTLTEAIAKTKEAVKELDFGDYTIGETYLVDITSDSEARMAKLSREVEEAFKQDEAAADSAQLVLVTSTIEDRNTAQSLGISTGRYSALRQAKEAETQAEITSTDVDEFKSKAVKDLVNQEDKAAEQAAKDQKAQAQTAASTAASKAAPVVQPQAPEPEVAPQPAQEIAQTQEQSKPAATTKKKTTKKKKSAEAASTEATAGDTAEEGKSGEASTGASKETTSGEAASAKGASAATAAASAATAVAETGASETVAAAESTNPAAVNTETGASVEEPAAQESPAQEQPPASTETEPTDDATEGSGEPQQPQDIVPAAESATAASTTADQPAAE